jgi:type I restriction enzyme M protein
MCNILRGDGIGYNEYMSELTYLLFLKIAKETGTEIGLPDDRRWVFLPKGTDRTNPGLAVWVVSV